MGGRLEGKVALISGAARGQGAVHAELFANEGASVVLGDILEKEVRFVADEIRAGGGAAEAIELDVTSPRDWIAAVELLSLIHI